MIDSMGPLFSLNDSFDELAPSCIAAGAGLLEEEIGSSSGLVLACSY